MTGHEPGEPVIELRRFSFQLGNKLVLRDVSFAVGAGEYLSVIGPNGAGKTTLLRCLVRFYTGGSGSIRVFGRPLDRYAQRELARRIAYVPQSDGQGFAYTVEQFVWMGRYAYFSPFSPASSEDRRAVRRALEMTGTARFADRPLNTLSGGERQAVFIAAALAQAGQVLLLDEPTTFLDYRHQTEIRKLLRRVNRQWHTTVVSVTHDVNGAVLDSDRVLALRDGSVAFCGRPESIMRRQVLAGIYDTGFLLVPHPAGRLPVIVPPAAGEVPA